MKLYIHIAWRMRELMPYFPFYDSVGVFVPQAVAGRLTYT